MADRDGDRRAKAEHGEWRGSPAEQALRNLWNGKLAISDKERQFCKTYFLNAPFSFRLLCPSRAHPPGQGAA